MLSDLADSGYHPLVHRYLLLQTHYRSQFEFSWEAMDSARAGPTSPPRPLCVGEIAVIGGHRAVGPRLP